MQPIADDSLVTLQVQRAGCEEVDDQKMHQQGCGSDGAREQQHDAVQLWQELRAESSCAAAVAVGECCRSLWQSVIASTTEAAACLPDRPSRRLPGRISDSVSGSQECARSTVYASATGMKMRLLLMTPLVCCHCGLQVIYAPRMHRC